MPTPPNITPPTGNSRSSSPGSGLTPGSAPGGDPKSRIVSGSLKDRIAKFNNPSAAPLVPTHAFGTPGPTTTAPSHTAQRGLVGNRIPTLDPKTALMVGGARKVSESRGLIGNRIPSTSGLSSIATAPSASVPKPSTAGSVRSSSPTGSIGSSSASGKPTATPDTSRSSSPPISPGHLPASLLAATLPDNGGPGASTPSSTMAEAGDEISHLSAPTTPIAAPELPPPGYDLVPGNLRLNAVANPAIASLAAQGSFAPSISSSLASQYDPSRASEDQDKMMADVSGISTPMGTPKAATRDLEGSVAGGSARGEGSVADMDDLRGRLEGLHTEEEPETPHEEKREKDLYPALETDDKKKHHHHPDPNKASDLQALKEGRLNDTAQEEKTPVPAATQTPPQDSEDPNQASDLGALKKGQLASGPAEPGTHNVDQNPVNNVVEATFAQNVSEHVIRPEEVKKQGGEAGTRVEEYENPEDIEPMVHPPGSQSKVLHVSGGDDADKENGNASVPKARDEKEEEESQVSRDGNSNSVQEKQDNQHDGQDESKSSRQNDTGPDESESTQVDVGESPKDGDLASSQLTVLPEAPDHEMQELDLADMQRPLQIHIEPAPIAQPKTSDASEVTSERDIASAKRFSCPNSDTEPVTQSNGIDSSSFPSAPTDDPDVIDPDRRASLDTGRTSTPLDPAFIKSFPDVPDEEKPRVQVHVSSPLNTPSKPKSEFVHSPMPEHTPKAKFDATDSGSSPLPLTPLANIPGHSKSLSNPPPPDTPATTDTDIVSQPSTPAQPPVGVEFKSKQGDQDQRRSSSDSVRSNASGESSKSPSSRHLSLNVDDGEPDTNTPRSRLSKRLSHRKSPKSPLLDDEDPGDFEPGEEGWAVVTKGRED